MQCTIILSIFLISLLFFNYSFLPLFSLLTLLIPTNAPEKVEISPKATSTELSISPGGGNISDAISNPHPTAIVPTAIRITIISLLSIFTSFLNLL